MDSKFPLWQIISKRAHGNPVFIHGGQIKHDVPFSLLIFFFPLSFMNLQRWDVRLREKYNNIYRFLNICKLGCYQTIFIVKINSMIWSVCLCHYVLNGLSYLSKETKPKQCISDAKPRSGIRDLEWNKHQLLHRIQSIQTSLIYNIFIDI